MSFDLDKFRSEFLQSDCWKVSDCYKPYDDKFLRKDAQNAYEGAKWGYESRQAEIDGLQNRIDEAVEILEYNEYVDSPLQALNILKGETK